MIVFIAMVKVATKTCSKCHACKPVDLFRKKGNQCKVCIAAKRREYYQGYKETFKAKQREYYQNNKEKQREYYQMNKAKIGAKRSECKEKIADYYKANKSKIVAQQREYQRERYHFDPTYAIKLRLRSRMSKAVKAAGLDKKCDSSSELLGISYQGLKEWLEAQFTEGMTWELSLIHI